MIILLVGHAVTAFGSSQRQRILLHFPVDFSGAKIVLADKLSDASRILFIASFRTVRSFLP
jgi:hypothetical protein